MVEINRFYLAQNTLQTVRFSLFLLVSALALLLAACSLSAQPIDCPDDLQIIWDEFPQYGGQKLAPSSMPHRPWSCDNRFKTTASAGEIVDYYEAQLSQHGWHIERDYELGNNVFADRGCLKYQVLGADAFKQEVWVMLSSARTIADVVERGSIPPADAGPLAPLIEGDYKTLLAILQETKLDQLLQEEGPFTLFAPTQDAFAALSETERQALLTDRTALETLLRHHIIPQALGTEPFVELASDGSLTLDTLAGDTITLQFDGYSEQSGRQVHRRLFGILPEIAMFFHVKIDGRYAKISVDGANLSLNMAGPTQACNGVIYMIDQVLTTDSIS